MLSYHDLQKKCIELRTKGVHDLPCGGKGVTKEVLKKIISQADCPLIPYKYHDRFYSKEKGNEIIEYLKSLPYEHTYYYFFNKVTKSPRKMIWYAENDKWTYHFSNNHIAGLKANKFTNELIKIKNGIEKFTGKKFNALLVNEYKGGVDRIDWHSDNDRWLGSQFIVPSISLGAERTFKLRLKLDKKHILSLKLGDGSLTVMKDKCQELWEHSIPSEKKVAGTRYNLTFRYIHPSLVDKQPKGKTWKYITEKYDKLKAGKEYVKM